jgi:hypothetical protein
MAEKKWSKGVDIKEGALTALGWPNVGAVAAKIRSGAVEYKTVISRLNYAANLTKDAPTKTKMRAAIVRLQREFGKEKKGEKKGAKK